METNNPTTCFFTNWLILNTHVGGYNRHLFNLEFLNLTTKVDIFNTLRLWVVQVHRGTNTNFDLAKFKTVRCDNAAYFKAWSLLRWQTFNIEHVEGLLVWGTMEQCYSGSSVGSLWNRF